MGSALHTTYCSDQAQEFTSCVHSPALPCSRKTALVFPFTYIRTIWTSNVSYNGTSVAVHCMYATYYIHVYTPRNIGCGSNLSDILRTARLPN